MDYYKNHIPIIDDSPLSTDVAFPSGATFGAVPRDYSVQPLEMFDEPSGIRIYSDSEVEALYDEQEEQQSSLEHIYLSGPGETPRFVNLDQNGHGYCWSYSGGHAVMLTRLRDNQPIIRLNPHSTAAIIKRGRDEGGWCGLSAQFLREHGMAEEGNGSGQWPLHSRNLDHDTPALRERMKLFRVDEHWIDVAKPVYDQTMQLKQAIACVTNRQPCPMDFSWWGHSVCALRWVRIEPGSWGWLILNSWKGWGRHGLGVIRGSKVNFMGAVSFRTVTAAA